MIASTPRFSSRVAASIRRAHARQRVDVEARVELVEDRDRGLQHRELQGFVPLLLATRKVDVERPLEEAGVEPDPHGLGRDEVVQPLDVTALRAQCFGEHRVEAHARHLGRVLEREEEPCLRSLPRFERQDVDAVEGHRPGEHLVARPSHQHVRERRLARAVRPHDRVHLAARDREVDAAEDLASPGCGAEALDLEHGHASSSAMST